MLTAGCAIGDAVLVEQANNGRLIQTGAVGPPDRARVCHNDGPTARRPNDCAEAVALAIVVAVLPGRRGTMHVAAFGAAVLIALQLTVNYWLYPYIVWFFPLVLVALFASHPEPGQHLYAAWNSADEQPSDPPSPAPPAGVANWSTPTVPPSPS